MRNTRILYHSLLLIVLLSLWSCKKKEDTTTTEEAQPLAEFTTEKSEYLAGENIHLVNTSTIADRFRWTFPDGSTGKSKDADYPSNEALGAHSLTFKLEAYSPNSTKSDYTVKIIKVKANQGQVVFYTFNFNHLGANVDVSVDGSFYTQVTLNTTGTVPICGQAGFPTIQIPVGLHLITVARNGFGIASFNVTISKSACTVLQI